MWHTFAVTESRTNLEFLTRTGAVFAILIGTGRLRSKYLYRQWFWRDEYTWSSAIDADSLLGECMFQPHGNASCIGDLLSRCAPDPITGVPADCSGAIVDDVSWKFPRWESVWGTSLDFPYW